MHDMSYNFDEESSLDVSSPRCLNSPSVSIYNSNVLLLLLLKIISKFYQFYILYI